MKWKTHAYNFDRAWRHSDHRTVWIPTYCGLASTSKKGAEAHALALLTKKKHLSCKRCIKKLLQKVRVKSADETRRFKELYRVKES